MANINLNNYFRKNTDKVSPVDSRIQLNKKETDNVLWGDLKLDLEFNEIKERPLNAKESTHDLKRSINEESVVISLRNLFNTHGGSRLLNPELSFNVYQYLFEPLSATKAWFLGYDIMQFFPLYEPRVQVQNVEVVANLDESVYEIKLTLGIPNVSKEAFKISSILSEDGFTVI